MCERTPAWRQRPEGDGGECSRESLVLNYSFGASMEAKTGRRGRRTCDAELFQARRRRRRRRKVTQ